MGRSGTPGRRWLRSRQGQATYASGLLLRPLPAGGHTDLPREAVSLDRLSSGRLVLGVGLGVNTDGEMSRFGEDPDSRILA